MRILIVKLSSIGDVVMTTPAARALRRHLPDASISWVVEPKSAGILEGNPDIDNVFVWNRESFKDFLQLARSLRDYKFDAAIDFQGLARSALVTAASGARRRIGFADSREGSKLVYHELVPCPIIANSGRCFNHAIRCYLELLRPLGVECDESDDLMRVNVSEDESAAAENILVEVGVRPGEKTVALCPATTRDDKHWTVAGWSALTDMFWNETGVRGVFLGSNANRPLIDEIMAGSKAPAVSVAGSTSLKEASAVLNRSEAVVAVDTGLLHVGVAIDKPTVGIFGPTPHWSNHAHRANFEVVRNAVECAPCRKKSACEHYECITGVKPEEVFSAAQGLISKLGSASD
jgi:heptosyltransferase-1